MFLQEDVSMPEEEGAAASGGTEAAAEAAAAEEAMSEDEAADGATPQKRKEAPADVVGFHYPNLPSLEAWQAKCGWWLGSALSGYQRRLQQSSDAFPSAQASTAKRQKSKGLLLRRGAADGAPAASDGGLEDSEASGAAGQRPVCINLLDDSDDDDGASSPQRVSLAFAR